LFAGLTLSGLNTPVLAASPYTVTHLGSLGVGMPYSYAASINNNGQAVGWAYAYNPAIYDYSTQAFLYSNGSMSSLLGNSGGYQSIASSINDNGQVVGRATTLVGNNYQNYAYLYSNGSLTNLGYGDFSGAYGINNNGQVVGKIDYGSTSRPFLYSNGGMTDLGTLGGNSGAANGINDNGQVVGTAQTTIGDNASHAFLYSNGSMTDLGTLGGSQSIANAINDNGQIVGSSSLETNGWDVHAFLYSNGSMTDIGSMWAHTSTAKDINNNGQVVGYFQTPSQDANGNFISHAFLYSNGTMFDLNSLIDPDSGWTLTDATGINDMGQIVGNGIINGAQRSFITSALDMTTLTAVPPTSTVPVPTTAWLLGSGLLGLIGVARRKAV
jgi:probable HAF family extracellular repeat protein